MTKQEQVKFTESLADTLKPSKVECPKCGENLTAQFAACIPEKQVMYMKLTSGTGAWTAKTIGSVIVEFDKLLKMVAKDIGGKVEVFIESIERSDKDIDVGFLITSVPSPKR